MMHLEAQITALRTFAGVALRPEISTLRLSGPDRVRFLNGMVTQNVSKLVPGHATTALKTNNRGRIEGVLRIRATADSFLLDVRGIAADRVRTALDQFIIMDDCAIDDISESREVLSVLGPAAMRIVGPDAPLAGFVQIAGAVIIADRSLGLDGYEIHVPRGAGAERLQAIADAGALIVSPEALDVVRVESGVPIDGRDLDEDTLPMEARLEPAISLDKGCYIGQEVIMRGMVQGQVNHVLVGLRFPAGPPPEGAALFVSERDKAIGEVTSVVGSPTCGPIGLGYVHRKYEPRGTSLVARIDEHATWVAEVAGLPFIALE